MSAFTLLMWSLCTSVCFFLSLCEGSTLPWNLAKHAFSHVRALNLALVQHAIKSARLLWIHQCLAALMFCAMLLRMPLLFFPTCGSDPLEPGDLPTRKGTQNGSDAYTAAVMLWVLCIGAVYVSKMQLGNVGLLH